MSLHTLPLVLTVIAWIIFQLRYAKTLVNAWARTISGDNSSVHLVVIDVLFTVAVVLAFVAHSQF